MRVGMAALLSALLSGRGGTAGNAGRVVGNQVPEVSTSVISSPLISGDFSTCLDKVFDGMRGERGFDQRKMELIASIYGKCDMSTYDEGIIRREVKCAMGKDEEFLKSLDDILSLRDDVDERTKAQFSGNIFSIDGIYDIEADEMKLLGDLIREGFELSKELKGGEWGHLLTVSEILMEERKRQVLEVAEIKEDDYKIFLEKIRVLADIYGKCEEGKDIGRNLDPGARISALADEVQKKLGVSGGGLDWLEDKDLEKLKCVDEMLDTVKPSCIKFDGEAKRWIDRADGEDLSVLEVIRDEAVSAKENGKDVIISDLEGLYNVFSIKEVARRIREDLPIESSVSWFGSGYVTFSRYVCSYVREYIKFNRKFLRCDHIDYGVAAKKLSLLLKMFMIENWWVHYDIENKNILLFSIFTEALEYSDLRFLEFVDKVGNECDQLDGAYRDLGGRFYLLDSFFYYEESDYDVRHVRAVEALTPDQMEAFWNIFKGVSDRGKAVVKRGLNLNKLIKGILEAVRMGLDLPEGVTNENARIDGDAYLDKYKDFRFLLEEGGEYSRYVDHCVSMIKDFRNGRSPEEYEHYLKRIGPIKEYKNDDIVRDKVENEIREDIKKLLSICAACRDYRQESSSSYENRKEFFIKLFDLIKEDFECFKFLYDISKELYVFGEGKESRPDISWFNTIVDIYKHCRENLDEDGKSRVLNSIKNLVNEAGGLIEYMYQICDIDSANLLSNRVMSNMNIAIAKGIMPCACGELPVNKMEDKVEVIRNWAKAYKGFFSVISVMSDDFKIKPRMDLEVFSSQELLDNIVSFVRELIWKDPDCLGYLGDIGDKLRYFGDVRGCMPFSSQFADIVDIYEYCHKNLGEDVRSRVLNSIKSLVNEAGGFECFARIDYGFTNKDLLVRFERYMDDNMRKRARDLITEGLGEIKKCISDGNLTVENIEKITREIEKKRDANPVHKGTFDLSQFSEYDEIREFENVFSNAVGKVKLALKLVKSGRRDIMSLHISEKAVSKRFKLPSLDEEIKITCVDRSAKVSEIVRILKNLEEKTGIKGGVFTGDVADMYKASYDRASEYFGYMLRSEYADNCIDDMFKSVKWLDGREIEVNLGKDLGEETAKLARELIKTTNIDCEKIKKNFEDDEGFVDKLNQIISKVPEQSRHFENIEDENVDEFLGGLRKLLESELAGLKAKILDERLRIRKEKDKELEEKYGRCKLAQEKVRYLMDWRKWLRERKYEKLSVPLDALKSVFGEIFDKERVSCGKTLLLEKEEFKEIRNQIEAAMLVYDSVYKYSSHNGHCLVRAKSLINEVRDEINKFLLYSKGCESISEKDRVFASIKDKVIQFGKEKVLKDIGSDGKAGVYSLGLADGSPLDIISGKFVNDEGRITESVDVDYKVRVNIGEIIKSGCYISIDKYAMLADDILRDFPKEDSMKIGYIDVTEGGKLCVEGSYKTELTFDEYCDYTGRTADEKEKFKDKILELLKGWELYAKDECEALGNWMNGNRKLSFGFIISCMLSSGLNIELGEPFEFKYSDGLAFVISAIKEGLLEKKISQ